MEIITRGDLHFTGNEKDGFVCQELQGLARVFEERCPEDVVESAIKHHLGVVREMYHARLPREGEPTISEDERKTKGGEIFDEIVASIKLDGLDRFQRLLFWLSDWWHYHQELIRRTTRRTSMDRVQWNIEAVVDQLIQPIMPEQVCMFLRGWDILSVATGFGHFAILFESPEGRVRRIVTDTQLFEIQNVAGYVYLDVTPDGKPITRSTCPYGGQRAFFDGVRLMAHRSFATCAPKVVLIDGGYKVNSTGCTIVNGQLFDLIDVMDAVAHTTGAFMGLAGFSDSQFVESMGLAEQTGGRMKVVEGQVLLEGVKMVPVGRFEPSIIHLRETGFALYEWSRFLRSDTGTR